MAKKNNCGCCIYWIRDENWDADNRKIGDCYAAPPTLCQTLIPAVIRDSGYHQLRRKQEKFQMRPVTQKNDLACYLFKPKTKKGTK